MTTLKLDYLSVLCKVKHCSKRSMDRPSQRVESQLSQVTSQQKVTRVATRVWIATHDRQQPCQSFFVLEAPIHVFQLFSSNYLMVFIPQLQGSTFVIPYSAPLSTAVHQIHHACRIPVCSDHNLGVIFDTNLTWLSQEFALLFPIYNKDTI